LKLDVLSCAPGFFLSLYLSQIMLKVVLIAYVVIEPLACWGLSKRDAKSVATSDEKAAEVKAGACFLCQRAHLYVRRG
jgi:hypothetical protein